jgi:hypothetical protein
VRKRQIPKAVVKKMKNHQIKEAKRRKLASDLHGSIVKW